VINYSFLKKQVICSDRYKSLAFWYQIYTDLIRSVIFGNIIIKKSLTSFKVSAMILVS